MLSKNTVGFLLVQPSLTSATAYLEDLNMVLLAHFCNISDTLLAVFCHRLCKLNNCIHVTDCIGRHYHNYLHSEYYHVVLDIVSDVGCSLYDNLLWFNVFWFSAAVYGFFCLVNKCIPRIRGHKGSHWPYVAQ